MAWVVAAVHDSEPSGRIPALLPLIAHVAADAERGPGTAPKDAHEGPRPALRHPGGLIHIHPAGVWFSQRLAEGRGVRCAEGQRFMGQSRAFAVRELITPSCP